jgi:hypothetical protein
LVRGTLPGQQQLRLDQNQHVTPQQTRRRRRVPGVQTNSIYALQKES